MATQEEELHDEIQQMNPSHEKFIYSLMDVILRLNERIGVLERDLASRQKIEYGGR